MNAPALPFAGFEARFGPRGFLGLVRLGGVVPARALAGLPAADAPALAARLNALCPVAHEIVVRRALEAATGADADETLAAARALALEIEAAAAAAFRFCLAWPRAFARAPEPGPVRLARKAAAAGDPQAAASALREALAFSHALPEASGRRFAAMRADARRRARRLAKAVPLARVEPDRPARSGAGEASVATLRGTLACALTLAEGRIAAARLSSPTDRAFAPGGPAARAFARLRPSPHLALEANRVALAFDPCLPVRLAFEADHA